MATKHIKRLTINASSVPAMTIDRRAIKHEKLVYLICAPRALKYGRKRSRILYIGTTERGVRRVASSIAHKAIDFLGEWGVRSLQVCLVTCPLKPGTKSWPRLERDLLIAFKLEFGAVPKANKSGKNFTPDGLSRMFNYRRLVRVVNGYA